MGRKLTKAKDKAVTANTVDGWMAKEPNAKDAGAGGACVELAPDDDDDDDDDEVGTLWLPDMSQKSSKSCGTARSAC